MSDEKLANKKISRREFLKYTGVAAAGAVIGGNVLSKNIFEDKKTKAIKKEVIGNETVSFYGVHQSGIADIPQKNCYFVVLDLHSTKKEDVINMFKEWTIYTENLVEGNLVEEELKNKLLPPKDTGETVGLNPYRLSITYGVSISFLEKLGLSHKKPKEFKDLPHFPKDQLKEEFTGGDIFIQACADDLQVAFHAVRNLIRKSRQIITMKWSQSGFLPIGNRVETPRNLFGFKDGTANHLVEDTDVWCDQDNWMKNGTYMAVRKIQMHLETWDRTSLQEQENTFGRYKVTGAPFGSDDEFAKVDLEKLGSDGNPLIPIDSHTALAHKTEQKILRRAYSYSSGINEKTGQFDAGLLFISFQKDPEQFIKIQNSLGAQDKLNEYITHIGSGLFACFPGVKKGGYIGEELFK